MLTLVHKVIHLVVLAHLQRRWCWHIYKVENEDTHVSHDQMLKLGKEEREKQKAQGKGIKCRSYFVLVIKTLSECDHI